MCSLPPSPSLLSFCFYVCHSHVDCLRSMCWLPHRRCPLEDTCNGDPLLDQGCTEGYTGPLCGQCSEGWSRPGALPIAAVHSCLHCDSFQLGNERLPQASRARASSVIAFRARYGCSLGQSSVWLRSLVCCTICQRLRRETVRAGSLDRISPCKY